MEQGALQHKNIKVNGINMHYVEQGKGELIVLLHGFPEFWYSWRKQIPELAKHYHVIAPDLRGYNETDKPRGKKNYALDILTRDIVELIQSTGKSKATVVAHDWGGGIAWELGIHYPELLDKLIILNSPHPSIMKKHLLTNPKQRKRSWYMFAFQTPVLPELFLSLGLRKFLKDTFQGWAYNKESFTDADIDEYVKAFKKKGVLHGSINYYRAIIGGTKKDQQKRPPVSVPTLIIWGENDKALGKELTYDMDKYFTAPYRVEYLSRCSHWVQHEYPEKVNSLILDFIKD